MKRLILYFLITAASVTFTAFIIPGISLLGSIQGLAVVTIAFTFVSMVVKPLLKALSLPIEIATLGLFTIIIDTFLFLIIDFLLVPLSISSFWFPGIALGPIIIAPVRVPALVTALIGSIVMGATSAVLNWLTD